MDTVIAALHLAAEYRCGITALLMGSVTAALVLLPRRPALMAPMVVAALMALVNQFFGHRLAERHTTPGGSVDDHPVGGSAVEGSAVEGGAADAGHDSRGVVDGRVITRSPRQVETAR